MTNYNSYIASLSEKGPVEYGNVRQKERQESRGAPATLKGYMIKLNQLALIIPRSTAWKPVFRDTRSSLPVIR